MEDVLRALSVPLVALVLGCGPADQPRIVLHNATDVDLMVHLDEDPLGRALEILPGETGELELRSPLRIDFGIVAHEFDFAPVSALGRSRVRLQARSDGRLYLVAPEGPLPAEVPPDQPRGFPLVATSVVDLT